MAAKKNLSDYLSTVNIVGWPLIFTQIYQKGIIIE